MICLTPASCVLIACERDVGAAELVYRSTSVLCCNCLLVDQMKQRFSTEQTPVVQQCWPVLVCAGQTSLCLEAECACCLHQVLMGRRPVCQHPAADTNPRQELQDLERQ